jgi:hypothetical protein
VSEMQCFWGPAQTLWGWSLYFILCLQIPCVFLYVWFHNLYHTEKEILGNLVFNSGKLMLCKTSLEKREESCIIILIGQLCTLWFPLILSVLAIL